MNKEQTVSHNIIDSLKAFDNDYLAEVFRLWNCDIRDWHDPYAAVFGFESNDVMIWKENGVLRYHLGAIDIDSAFDSLPAIVKASVNFDTCLS